MICALTRTAPAILLALLPFLGASAQSLNDVISRHLAAVGGLAKIRAVKTVRYEQSLSTQGINVVSKTTVIVGQAARTDVQVGGQTVTTVYNGSTGWIKNAMLGAKGVQPIPPAQVVRMRGNTEITGLQLAYAKDRGYPMRLAGREMLNGKSAYHVVVTRPEAIVDYYLNPDTYLAEMTKSQIRIGGQAASVQGLFGDFKRTDGLMLPTSATIVANGQPVISRTLRTEFNVPVDKALFIRPK